MSFLNEVLTTSDEAALLTLKKKLPTLSTQVSSYKQEVLKYIDDVYFKFSDWPKHNQKLVNVSSQLSNELDALHDKIEQVLVKEVEKANAEVSSLSEELDRSNIQLQFVTRIIKIHEGLLTVKKLHEDDLFINAGYALINLEELISNVPEDEVTEVVCVLKDNVAQEKVSILNALHEMFHHVIQIHSKVTNNIQTNTIKITKNSESITELLDVLGSFKDYNATLDRVFKFILEVCKGVIQNVATIKFQDEETHHVLVVAVKKTVVKCQHQEILSKCTEIFAFLYSYFEYPIGNELTTMRYFQSTASAHFTEMLINDCLVQTKATSDSEYANYESVIASIVEFQERLVEFNILDCDNEILKYAKNMDELLIEQKCNQYLAGAITLMKKDLHDSSEVGEKCDDGNLLAPEEFPRSVISRSVIDLLELVRMLLEEALEASDQCAARLVCTAQSIFYQYGNIVHGHHERLLLTIPQQVALFRNNCLYIAHCLDQINGKYSDKFSPAALPSPPLFIDQRHQLQTIGGEIFLGYIDEQVRVVEAMLAGYLSPAQVADKLNPDLEKLIRQCLRQYELLRTVWIKILPQAVYNKSIGYLFNSFCKKLIANVVNAQDIPSKNAEQILETFKVVLTRGPKLFSSSQDIGLYVEMWAKLNDLVFILGANLAGISDMWAEGKGVLTLTFPAEEVRNLIKALFQNTDRRAAVLSRIH